VSSDAALFSLPMKDMLALLFVMLLGWVIVLGVIFLVLEVFVI
jgi:hypothetical protein